MKKSPQGSELSKAPSSYRLTERARRLLRAVADEMGVSQTAALETLIREGAKRRGIA